MLWTGLNCCLVEAQELPKIGVTLASCLVFFGMLLGREVPHFNLLTSRKSLSGSLKTHRPRAECTEVSRRRAEAQLLKTYLRKKKGKKQTHTCAADENTALCKKIAQHVSQDAALVGSPNNFVV